MSEEGETGVSAFFPPFIQVVSLTSIGWSRTPTTRVADASKSVIVVPALEGGEGLQNAVPVSRSSIP